MTQLSEHLHQRAWRFPLTDESCEPSAFFEQQAKAMAAALNYKLVATTKIEVKPFAAMRIVSGTALLEGKIVQSKGGRLAKKVTR